MREVIMKNIVITGSTKGLGLAMAKEFLKSDCNVTISGRSDVLSDTLVNEFEAYNDKYHYVPCNVKNKCDIETLWRKAADKWGNIDIWINVLYELFQKKKDIISLIEYKSPIGQVKPFHTNATKYRIREILDYGNSGYVLK